MNDKLSEILKKAREKKELIPSVLPALGIKKEAIPVKSSNLDELRKKMALRMGTSKTLPVNTSSNTTEKVLEVISKGGKEHTEIIEPIDPIEPLISTDMHGNTIEYNTEQQQFVQIAEKGENCILIGAAGTGKTTCMQGAIQALLASSKIPILQADSHKHLVQGAPGIIIVAYTRRAVNNIRKVVPKDMRNNCITVHKLLEYQPEFFEVETDSGEMRKTMQFLPSRHSHNPLPNTIHTIVVEESSMLSVELYDLLRAAIIHKIQCIFLGDINQLPPVFGSAILGYKMLQWEVVELTQVYRQALESPIIKLAHRILSGKAIEKKEFEAWHYPKQLKIHAWTKSIGADDATRVLAAFFKKAIEIGEYNIETDMILIPFNKACGTIELNKHIANYIARKDMRLTYEVLSGFNKHYFTVGDKVLYEKEDAEIIEILPNPAYAGGEVQPASKYLDYWGYNEKLREESNGITVSDTDVDVFLDAISSDSEDRVMQASHTVVVKLTDSSEQVSVSTAADINNLLLSYALTVHKAQGSEWKKVFLCLHQSHATMLQRELLYTAITRARQNLYVICEPDSFVKGIERQKIKGNTLAEKAEFFKGKIARKNI